MSTQAIGNASSSNQTTQKPAVILLVEDEPIVREITGKVLESAGYEVLECSGPKEALGLADSYPGRIDLLLTDIVMPEMSGIALAEKIRSLQPEISTLFMSGYTSPEVFRKCTASSGIPIQKPFTVSFLLSRIAEALAAARGRDDLKRNATVAAGHPSAPALDAPAAFRGHSHPLVE